MKETTERLKSTLSVVHIFLFTSAPSRFIFKGLVFLVFFWLGNMTFFDSRSYFPFGVSHYSTFTFPICFVVKWLSDYQMGKGFFCTFVAMVTGYEGQKRNESWTSEIKLNQTTFAIRELWPQFTFSQWSYFYAKENKLFQWKRGGKGNFHLLYSIFLLKNFNFFFQIPPWYHVDTQFLFNQISVSLFILCLEGNSLQHSKTCILYWEIQY